VSQTKTKAKTAKKPAARTAAKKSSPKKGSATKAKAAKKKAAPKARRAAGDEPVAIDRRRSSDRRGAAASAETKNAAPPLERRAKVNRRRQIDPTTCERDYSDHEVEFMNAMDEYKRRSGRMFPTCSEVLEVIRDLGYVRLSASELAQVKAGRGELGGGASLEDAAEADAQAALAESAELRDE